MKYFINKRFVTFKFFADDGRMLAANSRGSALALDMPEWKRNILGGHKASFGKKEKKSILEQRQSLPIYKLKNELVKVCTAVQIL
jgi:ATP-dependent RNA helicase DHX8/PRP22